MNRSRLRNKYLKYPSRENFVYIYITFIYIYIKENFVNIKKKVKNKCNSICRKSKMKYLKRSTGKKISSNKQFWNFVKPFLANKGCMSNDFISIRDGDAFIVKKLNYWKCLIHIILT